MGKREKWYAHAVGTVCPCRPLRVPIPLKRGLMTHLLSAVCPEKEKAFQQPSEGSSCSFLPLLMRLSLPFRIKIRALYIFQIINRKGPLRLMRHPLLGAAKIIKY